MPLKIKERNTARYLRKHGFSLTEILERVPGVPKSTLSGWLRDIILTPAQQQRLIDKMRTEGAKGRQKGALKNHLGRLQRMDAANISARSEYLELKKKTLFFIGLSLYQAEGGKTAEMFQFINSDPRIIKLMIEWLTSVCKIDRSRVRIQLYLHQVYADQNCESFWQSVTNLPYGQFRKPYYKPSTHQEKKNPGYMGCCRIDVTGVEFFWKITTWIQLMMQDFLPS